jgi:GT2 family glycosyltransferase
MILRITVVVPSWRRPTELARCLAGLARQTRPADQIVVVRRDEDADTAQVIVNAPVEIAEATVNRPGMAAALVAGAATASGDIIAFTDDDAVPRPDWVARLLAHFDDAGVGAVGGRDQVHGNRPDPLTEDVGRLTRWGRLIGNHHCGAGPPRDVWLLKGVNMAFRREALALPLAPQGRGAQPHVEIAVCLWARKHGWRLMYDPATVVDHYPGRRFENDQRDRPSAEHTRAAAHNAIAGILLGQPELLWRRAAFGLLVGQSEAPGLIRAAAAIPRREWAVACSLPASIRGQLTALIAAGRGKHFPMMPLTPKPVPDVAAQPDVDLRDTAKSPWTA